MPSKMSDLSMDELLKKRTTTILESTLKSSQLSNKLHGFLVGGYIKVTVKQEGILIKLVRAGDRSFEWSFSDVRGVGRPRTTKINGVSVPFQKIKAIKSQMQKAGLKSASPTNMDKILNTIICHLSFVFPGCRVTLDLELSKKYNSDFQWKRALSGLTVHRLVLRGDGNEGFEQVMNNVRVNSRIENNCTFKNDKFEKTVKILQQPEVIWCRSAGWLNMKTLPGLRAGHMRFIMKRLDEDWIRSFLKNWKRSRCDEVDQIEAVVIQHPRRSNAALEEFEEFLENELRGRPWNGPVGDYYRETGTSIIVDCRDATVIRRKHLSGIVATIGLGYTALVVE
ncbi:unnamed protein product [Caenorhabditis brenneri]